MSLAFCEKLFSKNLNTTITVNLVDVSPLMLKQAEKLYKQFFPQVLLNTYLPDDFDKKKNSKNKSGSSLKLLLFSNSFNEIGEEQTLRYFKEGSYDFLLFLGVGTKDSFKNLMCLKSAIEQSKSYQILYPCKKSGAGCPMLENDWCHQTIRVKNDSDLDQVSQLAKIDRRSLAFTFHLYGKQGKEPVDLTLGKGALIPSTIIQFLGKNKASFRWRVCFFEQSVKKLKLLEAEFLLRGLSKKEKKELEQVQVGDTVYLNIEKYLDDSRIRITF